MNKKQYSKNIELEDIINITYLNKEDILWLKNKRWAKKFLRIYKKELLKMIDKKETYQKTILNTDDEIEILDFTKTIEVNEINNVVSASSAAKRRIKFEKRILSIVMLFSIIIILILIFIFINWLYEGKKTEKLIGKINKKVKVDYVKEENIDSNNAKDNVSKNPYSSYKSFNMIDVNFNKLLKINDDTKGWIKVNGTTINYPFVQTKDNEYYLEHSFDKSKNKKGWVFLDYRNNIDNLNDNTIIYAHGLLNNIMFGTLKNVVKPEWYYNKENHIIKISTINNNQLWKVFSTYTIEPENYYIRTKFENENEHADFIIKILRRSVYDYGTDVTVDDKILTLSSCYNKKKRVVLHAKLISSQTK